MRQRNIKSKIKNYFFINPNNKLRVRELERALKCPLPSIIRYCKELEKENILKKIKYGNIVFYTSSGSKEFILEKKLYNIKSLYKSGLVDYIKKELFNPGIVLFGSYSKGEDIESSDIDLYIETPSDKKLEVGFFEKKLKRNIQFFKHKSLKDISNSYLANNIVNGIVLNKYVEVF